MRAKGREARGVFGTHLRLCCGALAVFVLAAGAAYANQSWFSGVTVDGQTQPAAIMDEGIPEGKPGDKADPVLIDLSVSIYERANDEAYPDGDDDGDTQGVDADSAEQDVIERVFQYMADTIFEATEGAQKLRNVRIFTQGQRAASADILWGKNGSICAHVNGIAGSGSHVFMYDTGEWYNDDGSVSSSASMLTDEEGSGYTLGHEWGHYWYGVYDEYEIDDGDEPVSQSIMNSQWNAKGGQYAWLNFSIAFNGSPIGPWENTKKTAQHREHGESCWETLARNPATDQQSGDLNGTLRRVYYAELAGVAPTGTNTPAINIGGGSTTADARSDLKIIWSTDVVTYQIVIDHSGSMLTESKMENAKTAAQLLVERAEVGNSQVGVIIFDDAAEVLTPITEVDSEATRDQIRDSIANVVADGSTAIGDAAALALEGLEQLQDAATIEVVFLLSDGQSNSGRAPLSVIPDYQNAQVPIFTFAYGTDADLDTLRRMAEETGGEMRQSVTTLAEVQDAFEVALQRARGAQGLDSGASRALSDMPTEAAFEVDSTIGTLEITVTHAGQAGDALVDVIASDQTRLQPVATVTQGGETVRLYSAEDPLDGPWAIQVQAVDAGTPIPFRWRVTALPAGITYALSVQSLEGNELAYPEPMVIMATLEREMRIANANVGATVTSPSGLAEDIALLDDGIAPDDEAGDGRYTALYAYAENGVYTVDVYANNADGAAVLTGQGTQVTADLNGQPSALPPELLVEEDFQRDASLQILAQNVVVDDHGDTPGTATTVQQNNTPVPGIIGDAGDVDFFTFTPPADVPAMAFRVAGLANGMDPILTLTDRAGQEITMATMEDCATPEGGLLMIFPVEAGIQLFVSVRHADETAAGGLYQFSAGPATPFDVAADLELLIKIDGEGTATPDAGGHSYARGAKVTLEAVPSQGWAFERWDGDVDDMMAAKTSVEVMQNMTVTAVFIQKPSFIFTCGAGTPARAPHGDWVIVAAMVLFLAALHARKRARV